MTGDSLWTEERLKQFVQLQEEVRALVREINDAIGTGAWKPIVFHERRHDHDEVFRHYRAAD